MLSRWWYLENKFVIRHIYKLFFFLAKVFDYGLSSARRLVDVFFSFSKNTWWRWWSFTYRWLNHFLRWPKNCLDKIFTSKSRRFSQVFSIFVSRLSWMFSCKQIFIPDTRTSDFWLWKFKTKATTLVSWSTKKVEVLVEQNHSLSSNQKNVTFALHLLHWILVQTSRRVGWAIRPTADWWTNELVATRCEAVMDFVCGCWKTKF